MPRVTSTLRSHAEQTRLYRRYQQGLQALPVAPPGTSAHEFGYALDMVVSPFEYLSDVGAFWQGMGGVWGGQFNDPVHFEFPGFKNRSAEPVKSSDPIYRLIDFASGWLPWIGPAQLADTIFRITGGDQTVAEWYLQHPAEAFRDFLNYVGL
jgi:hypothetical protein